jgi:hypothetical protein
MLGRPVYVRVPVQTSAGYQSPSSGDPRSLLAIAYTGVRRPCICTGCIWLTPAERERQKRVFALARAYAAAASRQRERRS